MRIPFVLLASAFCLSGCMSLFQQPAFVFPEPTTESFRAPDGRIWRQIESKPELGGEYRLTYIPEDGDPNHWMEKLCFAISGPHMSKEVQIKGFDQAKARYDTALEFQFEGDDDAYVQTYYSPGYGEHSICRVVRTERGYISIEYRERLGPVAKKRLKFWTDYIRNMPNQALQTTSVTRSGFGKVPVSDRQRRGV